MRMIEFVRKSVLKIDNNGRSGSAEAREAYG